MITYGRWIRNPATTTAASSTPTVDSTTARTVCLRLRVRGGGSGAGAPAQGCGRSYGSGQGRVWSLRRSHHHGRRNHERTRSRAFDGYTHPAACHAARCHSARGRPSSRGMRVARRGRPRSCACCCSSGSPASWWRRWWPPCSRAWSSRSTAGCRERRGPGRPRGRARHPRSPRSTRSRRPRPPARGDRRRRRPTRPRRRARRAGAGRTRQTRYDAWVRALADPAPAVRRRRAELAPALDDSSGRARARRRARRSRRHRGRGRRVVARRARRRRPARRARCSRSPRSPATHRDALGARSGGRRARRARRRRRAARDPRRVSRQARGAPARRARARAVRRSRGRRRDRRRARPTATGRSARRPRTSATADRRSAPRRTGWGAVVIERVDEQLLVAADVLGPLAARSSTASGTGRWGRGTSRRARTGAVSATPPRLTCSVHDGAVPVAVVERPARIGVPAGPVGGGGRGVLRGQRVGARTSSGAGSAACSTSWRAVMSRTTKMDSTVPTAPITPADREHAAAWLDAGDAPDREPDAW